MQNIPIASWGGRNCGKEVKIIGVLFISKYMIKKYGAEEAIRRKLNKLRIK